MTIEDVKKLRKEIILGSCYVRDYANSFDIPALTACNFFEGYLEYISEIMFDELGEEIYGQEYWDKLKEYDTDENLESWWYCFDSDPFLGDDLPEP